MTTSTRSIGIAALIAAGSPSVALAYPLNPWGSAIPDKTVALNPFLYAYPGPIISPYMYAGVGVGGSFDVYAGASMSFANDANGGVSFDSVELFPRYFIGGTVGVTPHIFWYPNDKDLVVAPEIHYGGLFDKFGLTINTGWRPNFIYGSGGSGFDTGTLFAMVAPEYYFVDAFAAFVEFHEYYDVPGKANSNLIAPGIWFALDKDLVNSVCIAGQFSLPAEDPAANSLSLGVWYSTTFGIGGS